MTAPISGRRAPVRLAFVTASLDPGGAERQMLLLAEGLPHDEFAIDFICLQSAGPYADRARAAGATVHTLAFKSPRDWRGPRLLFAADLLWNIMRFVRLTAWRYDVIDAWLYHAYALAAVTRPLTWPRALDAGRRSLSGYKAEFNRLRRLGDAVAAHAADLVIANAEAVKADVVRLEGLDPSRVRVIHNAALPPLPMDSEERGRRRTAWGATDATIVIGSVANYKRGKGIELLIRAVASLVKTGACTDVRLVLVGEGPLRPELEALCREVGLADLVVLHGTELEARTVYPAFDVFAFASEAEGFPNVVLEAAAAGLPIVATAAGGTVEIVTDRVTGRLVPVGDQGAFELALQALCASATERTRLGRAAEIEVHRRYGGTRMVAEFAEIYREAASRRRWPWGRAWSSRSRRRP